MRAIQGLCRLAVGASFMLGAIRAPAEEPLFPLPAIQLHGTMPLAEAQPGLPHATAPPFAVVVVLDSALLNTAAVTFGDMDHDGLEEIVARKYSWAGYRWETWVFEEQGNDTYVGTHLTTIGTFAPYLTGDLDGDGKTELVGRYSTLIRVYESQTPTSYPTELVWESEPQSNVLADVLSTGDTDRDGRQELIYSYNLFAGTGRLKIFECTGDNAFTEVLSIPIGTGNSASSGHVICDLDGDGWDEIAMTSELGVVLVYEATGDNAWSLVWSDSTGLWNSQHADGGWDLDGNGRPELYVTGNNFSVPGSENITWDTRVYEAVGDNQYTLRTVLKIPYAAGGSAPAILADFDGDGDGEYLTKAGILWLFDAESCGTWAPIGSFAADAVPYCHDINKNGRWEIVLVGQGVTPILEAGFPTGLVVSGPALTSLVVSPNPFRAETRIAWSPTSRVAHRLAVYDVGGRVIEERRVGGNSIIWSARALPAGVYFVQVEDGSGRPIARGRAIASR